MTITELRKLTFSQWLTHIIETGSDSDPVVFAGASTTPRDLVQAHASPGRDLIGHNPLTYHDGRRWIGGTMAGMLADRLDGRAKSRERRANA